MRGTNIILKEDAKSYCMLCRWFVDDEQKKNPIIDGVRQVRSGAKGICRRFPPQNRVQPTVDYFDICGEYRKD